MLGDSAILNPRTEVEVDTTGSPDLGPLIIVSDWRAVADTALAFVQRVRPAGAAET
jgi:hypothetical protein